MSDNIMNRFLNRIIHVCWTLGGGHNMGGVMSDDLMESMVNNQEWKIAIQVKRDVVELMSDRELNNNQYTELEEDII